jgi:hypothetical protein
VIEVQMSPQELLAQPVSVDLVTAGRAFGLGRSKSYELARAGEFPCKVIPIGRRADGTAVKYRVPRSALLDALGIEDERPVRPTEVA